MTLTQHLTKRQRRELERELQRECARLERSIMAREAREDTTPASDEGLRVEATGEIGLTEALETRVLTRHQLIVSALRRLEDGSYGVCLSCGNPIPYGRLLVVPEATSCVTCSPGI